MTNAARGYQVVDYEHSVKLCADNNFSLETVESGPHSMMALTKTGLLAELVCKAAQGK